MVLTKQHREKPPSATRAERILVLITGYAKLAALTALAVLVGVFVRATWDDLRSLVPRVSHVKALGIDIDLLRGDLKQAATQRAAEPDVSQERSANLLVQDKDIADVLNRALRVKEVFTGATILWIDDAPQNDVPMRNLLRSLGAAVEMARDTAEAIQLANSMGHVDLVLSDISRGTDSTAGIEGLKALRATGLACPAIFYVLNVDRTRPAPVDAIGITNRPDELMHFIIDGLERARWTKPLPASQ